MTTSGVQPDGSWVPVFAGQRPPFTPGHELSLRYGAHSERVKSPLVDERFAELLQAFVGCVDDPGTALTLARAEVRAALLSAELEKSLFDAKGKPRESLLKWLNSAERLALECRRELGITPTAAARLRRDEAQADASRIVSLEELRRRGQPAVQRFLDSRGPTAIGSEAS